jgi:hypothetical protein
VPYEDYLEATSSYIGIAFIAGNGGVTSRFDGHVTCCAIRCIWKVFDSMPNFFVASLRPTETLIPKVFYYFIINIEITYGNEA